MYDRRESKQDCFVGDLTGYTYMACSPFSPIEMSERNNVKQLLLFSNF